MALLVLCSHLAAALSPSPTAPTSRRAVLSSAAAAAAAVATPWAAVAKDKGYLTLDEYNNLKKQEKKDEALYGLVEGLRARASQTGEFDKLASDGKLKEVSQLALAWDSNIRKELLDKANESLSGKDKDAGSKISQVVLNDLKTLDKLAKAGSKDDVPGVSAALRGHVLEFVALEPQRLQDKFGVGDL